MEDLNCSDVLGSDGNETESLAILIYRVHNYALLVLPIISIILNGFCLFIFFDKMWKKSILSTLLKYLSAAEIIFNLSGFIYAVTKFIDYPSISNSSKYFWVLIQQIGTFLVSTGLICRNWTILHLSAYRFESICRPLTSKKVYTDRYVCKILWATYCVAAILAFPRTFEFEASFCKGTLILKPGLLKYHLYEYGYQGSLIFIIQTGAPVIVTGILSIWVMRAIIKMKTFRKSLRNKSTKTNNAVSGDFLMIIICFTFFVLEIPSFFSKVLTSYLIKSGKVVEDIMLALMGNILVYLDSVINIFVYIVSNPNFRTKLKLILHVKSHDYRDGNSETVVLRRKELFDPDECTL